MSLIRLLSDSETLSQLRTFVNNVHASGMRYVVIVDPGISNVQENYGPFDDGEDMGTNNFDLPAYFGSH